MRNERESVAVAAPSEAEVTALTAEYYEAVREDIHKSRDYHWQIVESWSCGEHVGWFVEHSGYLYVVPSDGPHPSREAALQRMAEHLRAAIADTRESRWD